MVFITLLSILIIYFTYTDRTIKLNNFKQKQRRDLCKYLSNNMIFYDKKSLKHFMIDQYYDMVVFRGIPVLDEQTINSIYTNITNNNTMLIQIYNESCSLKDCTFNIFI